MKKGEVTTADEIDKMMNKKSGMLGISGGISANQEIFKRAAEGDEKCILVQKMYSHQLTKLVGGYIAAMGGADALVFTGGIGENTPEYRAYVCEKLAFLGVKIDAEKNKIRGEEIDISTPDSPIRILVIPTNEELVIARDTKEIVEKL
jgi:acetate kinase